MAAAAAQSLLIADEKQTPPKQKRATSFVRKKPPLERGLSAQSALRINKNALVGKLIVFGTVVSFNVRALYVKKAIF